MRALVLPLSISTVVACASPRPAPSKEPAPPLGSATTGPSASAAKPSTTSVSLSAEDLFGPGLEARFSSRAVLATFGPLRFDPTGVHTFAPNNLGSLAGKREVTVLEVGPDLLRVALVGQRAVRLPAYLEAKDFYEVVTTPVQLVLADGTTPKRAKIEARPGMLVTGKVTKDGRRIATPDDTFAWVEVGVPVVAIGRVFPAQPPPAPRHAVVAPDEPLLDGPGGPPIGTAAHTDAPVERLGEPEGAYVKVAIGGRTLRVEAWVRAAKVTPSEERPWEPDPQPFFLGGETLAWLPAGTPLFATPGGPQVALCEAPVRAIPGLFGQKDGHTSMRLPFEGWSYVGFWVETAVVDKAVAARKAADERLPRIKIVEKPGAGLAPFHHELVSAYPVATCLAEAEDRAKAAVVGRFVVTITVGAQGVPAKVVVTTKPALDPKLTECVRTAFGRGPYKDDLGAPATTGTVEVTVDVKAP